jgi:hemoglobin
MDNKLDETLLPDLLDRFYARVRADALLGPVFETVDDWPEHLTKLRDFWSSIMLTTGRYKGNPVAMHTALADRMEPALFTRWLELWTAETDAMLPPDIAATMQAKAARIAQSLQLAIQLHTKEGRATMFEQKPPSQPYKSTPVFDSNTLPAALRRDHNTKAGVWGVIRVLEGQVRYRVHGVQGSTMLDPDHPGLINPQELHSVEPVGTIRMQVDFYDHEPVLS